nr:hemocyte protein-glutamine gamma-glutamyltransferase-like isoform X1 [Leptinotarsa decemlineata]XP_023022031.1 hemocyte protein-glutamine gamma-glutamyltransferase-like isoform X1 [Leptinotarsa decemlineata]
MEPLTITGTELYIRDNAKQHHTDEYDLVKAETPTCILRRGAEFFLALRFNRDYDIEKDIIRISFGFGEKPNPVSGTKAVRPVLPKLKHFPKSSQIWGVMLTQNSGTSIVLNIRIPPHVPVGIWKISIATAISGQRGIRKDFTIPDDIYILFNPWCPEDGVYMENEEERQEYIMNETGKIWCGTFKKPNGKHWIFGQFDEISLPAAVFLLDKSELVPAKRGNPVMVSRAISAIINAVDDGGLLEGKWEGDYADGTSPFAWTGSTAILEQYLMTEGTPVKYGQCWVFSAATVTVCRALGIPCRSTTNYVSAHDTNSSLTVDKYFDIFGEKLESGPDGTCNDSCWNFHVWNDVWMTRPDLPVGYGGWQIIDATPQEQSDKVMRCGPASVAAVKKGEVGYLYDTPFVFSEVNADIMHFQEDEESDWGFSRTTINQYHVGRKIVTKKLGPTDDDGDSDLLDVTKLYKNPEGTEAERLAVYNAVHGVPRAQELYDIPDRGNEDVAFDLVDIDTVPFGETFCVEVKVENKSEEERTIKAVLSASSVYYTGTTAKDLQKSKGTVKIQPGKKETLRLEITPDEYVGKLVDHSFIKLYAIANVEETKQVWSEEDDFTFIMPQVTITVSGLQKIGETCEVNFSFRNPLDVPLTGCSYTAEGPGIRKPKIIKYRDVLPKEVINMSQSFTAKGSGVRKIVFNFTSKEIHNVHGSTKIKIEE